MKTCKRNHQRSDNEHSCKECRKITSKAWYHSNIEEKRAYMRKASKNRYKDKKHEERDKKLERLYGIKPTEYKQMLTNQNNVCKICKTTDGKRLCIDHCHSTGKVRGLLCNKCNKALGLFQDSLSNLNNAIKYLSTELS